MKSRKDFMHDEFRSLLSKVSSYSAGEYQNLEDQERISKILGVEKELLTLWIRGVGRPTPVEENRMLEILRYEAQE